MTNFPTLLSEEDKELLKGCTINEKIYAAIEQMRKDYDILCKTVPDLNKTVSFEEFKKGVIIASHRAYDLVYTDGSIWQVLIPFIEVAQINYGSP